MTPEEIDIPAVTGGSDTGEWRLLHSWEPPLHDGIPFPVAARGPFWSLRVRSALRRAAQAGAQDPSGRPAGAGAHQTARATRGIDRARRATEGTLAVRYVCKLRAEPERGGEAAKTSSGRFSREPSFCRDAGPARLPVYRARKRAGGKHRAHRFSGHRGAVAGGAAIRKYGGRPGNRISGRRHHREYYQPAFPSADHARDVAQH